MERAQAHRRTNTQCDHLLYAVIEYEDLPLSATADSNKEPFSGGVDDAIPLDRWLALRDGVDDRFLSALIGLPPAGVPTFETRGLPENISYWTEDVLSPLEGGKQGLVSWLGLQDIRDWLRRARLSIEDLNLETQVLFETIEFLGERLGADRVRMIYLTIKKDSHGR